ncbi:MAG: hypothetical protein ACXV7D_12545, partial [Thermoanaerobaculia bacterium]
TGIEPLVACKLLTDSIGAAAIVASWMIAPFFTCRRDVRIIIAAAFAPIALAWASSLITPDLLLACILLFYLLAMFRSERDASIGATIVAGLLGGLAYLAKSYALPFFVAHFTLVHSIRWMSADASGSRRAIGHRFLAGMAAFLAIASPWITAISLKYGHVTAGTAGSYSWHVIGPVVRGAHPVKTYGLIPPSDADALSIWDDPSGLRFPPWPVEMNSLLYLAQLAMRNAVRLAGIIESWSVLALPILFVAFDRVVRRRGAAGRQTIVTWTLVTGMIFAGGFMPLLLEERYLWFLEALLLLITAAVFDELAESRVIGQTTQRVLLGIVVVSFIVRPLLPRRVNQSGRIARQQAGDLARRGVDLHDKRLASDKLWESTLYLNYYAGAHYYGTPRPGEGVVEFGRELDRQRIDTFIVWGGARPAYLDGFRLAAVSPHSFAVYVREVAKQPAPPRSLPHKPAPAGVGS